MKNKVEWADIVKIGENYYLEKFPVVFEDSRLNEIQFESDESSILEKLSCLEKELDDFSIESPLYDCSSFFDAVRKKYNLSEDDEIETELFDNLDAPASVYEKYDVSWLGGYINGVNI